MNHKIKYPGYTSLIKPFMGRYNSTLANQYLTMMTDDTPATEVLICSV